jgi:hypothetical protein
VDRGGYPLPNAVYALADLIVRRIVKGAEPLADLANLLVLADLE